MRYRKERIPLIDTTDLLTVTEVAKRLKVTAQSVRTLIKNEYLNADKSWKPVADIRRGFETVYRKV